MLYGDNVQDTRQVFITSWQKYRLQQPLEPLEQQLVDIIRSHPEYHQALEANTQTQYFPELGETNPFLHMGLHLAIREQVALNRPAGITSIYQQLLTKHQDPLLVEHQLMEPLVECLWQAQRQHHLPDEATFLQACQRLLDAG